MVYLVFECSLVLNILRHIKVMQLKIKHFKTNENLQQDTKSMRLCSAFFTVGFAQVYTC